MSCWWLWFAGANIQIRSCAKQEKQQRDGDEDKKGKAKDVELNYVYVLCEYDVESNVM